MVLYGSTVWIKLVGTILRILRLKLLTVHTIKKKKKKTNIFEKRLRVIWIKKCEPLENILITEINLFEKKKQFDFEYSLFSFPDIYSFYFGIRQLTVYKVILNIHPYSNWRHFLCGILHNARIVRTIMSQSAGRTWVDHSRKQ